MAAMESTFARLLVEGIQPARGRHGWHGGATPLGAVRGMAVETALWRPAPGRKCIRELKRMAHGKRGSWEAGK